MGADTFAGCALICFSSCSTPENITLCLSGCALLHGKDAIPGEPEQPEPDDPEVPSPNGGEEGEGAAPNGGEDVTDTDIQESEGGEEPTDG